MEYFLLYIHTIRKHKKQSKALEENMQIIMSLDNDKVIERLKNEKKLITRLFIVSTVFGTSLFVLTDNLLFYIAGFFLYFLSTICLPKINRIKQDIRDTHLDDFTIVQGVVLAYFPEKESNPTGRWILILQTESGQKDFIFKNKIEKINEQDEICLSMTKRVRIVSMICT